MSTFPYEDEPREPECVPINDHDEVTPVENASIDYRGLSLLLLELEKQSPSWNDPEELADWNWFDRMWGDEVLTRHMGKNVVIRNRQVLDAGMNVLELRLKWAKKLQVHPGQLVIAFVDGPTESTLEEYYAEDRHPDGF